MFSLIPLPFRLIFFKVSHFKPEPSGCWNFYLRFSDKCSNTQAKYPSVYAYLTCVFKIPLFLHFICIFYLLTCSSSSCICSVTALVMIHCSSSVHGLCLWASSLGVLYLSLCIFSYFFMLLNL